MKILVACENCGLQYDVSDRQAGENLRCHCGAVLTVPQPAVRDARLVRCPSCGAVRGETGTCCEFCGARFAAVDQGWGLMCPHCFGRLPSDAHFCVECGLKIEPHDLHWAESELPCPRCKCNLTFRRIETLEMFECPVCAGAWLPASVFEKICAEKEARTVAARVVSDVVTQPRFQISESEQVRYIPCPQCHALMNRRNFADVSGVIIDICRDHGVWLDNQELSRIVQFIEAGGLDKAHIIVEQRRQHSERLKKLGTPVLRGTGDMSVEDKVYDWERWVAIGGPALYVAVRLLARLLIR